MEVKIPSCYKYFCLLVLVYGFFLALGSHAGFPTSIRGDLMPFLSDKPVGEDGFYMLTVAWNIAQGKGITYNGEILTTGIQPLSTFIFAAIAKLTFWVGGDKWTFVRFIIIFGTIIHIGLSFLVGILSTKINRKNQKFNNSKIFVISSALSLFSIGQFKLSTYGLETSLYLSSLSILIICILTFSKDNQIFDIRRVLIIGFISGITILFRIDSILVLGIFFILLFLRRIINFSQLIPISIVTSLIIAPWFIYVFNVTGSFSPTGASSQSQILNNFELLFFRLSPFLKALISHLGILVSPGRDFLYASSSFIFVIIISLYIFNSRFREGLKIIFDNKILNAFFISIVFLSFAYLYSSSAIHFYHRYISLFSLIFIPGISIGLSNVINFSNVLIYCLPLLMFSSQLIGIYHTGKISNYLTVSAGYINKNFNNDKYKVGAFQSGIAGYFNENIINLDGKVDHRVLSYKRQDGLDTGGIALLKDNFNEFIVNQGINIIIDKTSAVNEFLNSISEEERKKWNICDKPINNKTGSRESLCIIKS